MEQFVSSAPGFILSVKLKVSSHTKYIFRPFFFHLFVILYIIDVCIFFFRFMQEAVVSIWNDQVRNLSMI